MFGVYAGTSADKANEMTEVVAGEMRAMAESVDEDEVVRAKAQLRAGLLMALESPTARCEQIAGQLWAYGRLVPLKDVIARLDAVDREAVRRFAGQVASRRTLTLAALGPADKLDAYDRIAARFG
jgi:predicted Zn-dependent peptidase